LHVFTLVENSDRAEREEKTDETAWWFHNHVGTSLFCLWNERHSGMNGDDRSLEKGNGRLSAPRGTHSSPEWVELYFLRKPLASWAQRVPP
jgi:hypothetical protein